MILRHVKTGYTSVFIFRLRSQVASIVCLLISLKGRGILTGISTACCGGRMLPVTFDHFDEKPNGVLFEGLWVM